NKYIKHKLYKNLLYKFHLVKWNYDNDNIDKFFVFNHKKYAYEYWCDKQKKFVIDVKCGGIPNDSFNTDMTFEKFIETQFSDGKIITNTKSIYNKQETISIYESTTDLQKGTGYRIFSYDERIDDLKEKMFKEIEEKYNGDMDDMLYIESSIGTFSMSEVYPHNHETDDKKTLDYLKMTENNIKDFYL